MVERADIRCGKHRTHKAPLAPTIGVTLMAFILLCEWFMWANKCAIDGIQFFAFDRDSFFFFPLRKGVKFKYKLSIDWWRSFSFGPKWDSSRTFNWATLRAAEWNFMELVSCQRAIRYTKSKTGTHTMSEAGNGKSALNFCFVRPRCFFSALVTTHNNYMFEISV